MIKSLDHVNVRTNNLAEMTAFYQQVLKLSPGPRPEFSFDGAWLYCGDRAVVHLVETREPLLGEHVRLEHFAFKCDDFPGTRAHLAAHDIAHSITPVPGYDMTQIHLRDSDGNHVELNFDGRHR